MPAPTDWPRWDRHLWELWAGLTGILITIALVLAPRVVELPWPLRVLAAIILGTVLPLGFYARTAYYRSRQYGRLQTRLELAEQQVADSQSNIKVLQENLAVYGRILPYLDFLHKFSIVGV